MHAIVRFVPGWLLFLALVPPASALTPARFPDGEAPWTAGAACELTYYNVCNGWVWIWYDPPGPATTWVQSDRVGLTATTCCESSRLTATWFYAATTGYPGYGFLKLAVQAVDGSGCPAGLAIASQYAFPITGWNFNAWDVVVPPEFALVAEIRTQYRHAEGRITTDHPAGAGGSPPACGNCYPALRETRSRYWGTPAAPVCPGVPLFDGTCNAELTLTLMLDCPVPVDVQPWSSIKALYR